MSTLSRHARQRSCVLCCLQRPHKATQEEMTKFHSDDYIKFLRSIRPDNMSEFNKQMQRCLYSSCLHYQSYFIIVILNRYYYVFCAHWHNATGLVINKR